MDINTAIGKHSCIAIDVTHPGTGRDYAFKALCNCAGRHGIFSADFWLLQCEKASLCATFLYTPKTLDLPPARGTKVTPWTSGSRRTTPVFRYRTPNSSFNNFFSCACWIRCAGDCPRFYRDGKTLRKNLPEGK